MLHQTLLLAVAVITILLIFWLGSHLYSSIFYAPYVMADKTAINNALKLADLRDGEIFYDLGCGRGDALIIAAKNFKASATGYEVSPFPALLAKFRLMRYKNAKVILGNFKKANLEKSDVIYLYLFENVLAEIEDWLFQNIGDNTRVITLAFKFKKHEPRKIISTKNLGIDTNIYLYRK